MDLELNDSLGNMTIEECLQEKSIMECNGCYRIDTISNWMLDIHAAVLVAIISMSLIGNLLVVVLLLKYKKLRHRTAMISVSVIVANTCLLSVYHIPVLISTLSEKWQFRFVGCQILGYLSVDFIITRWLTMAVLAIDRFCVVQFPFRYPKFSNYIMAALFLISWVLPATFTATTLTTKGGVAFRDSIPTCFLYAPPGLFLYFGFVYTISFILGGILPLVLYIWLLNKARNIRNSVLRVGRSRNTPGERIINERKVSLTFGLIFTAFCLTGLPVFLFRILRASDLMVWCKIPHLVQFFSVELFVSATAVDPFLIMRDRDFRKRLRHFLCCHNNCGKYRANRSNVYPELPPERDFDAVKSIAIRALNLVSISSFRDGSVDRCEVVPRQRPRSGSAPATYLSHALGPLYKGTFSDMIEETDKEKESCASEGDYTHLDFTSWLQMTKEAVVADEDFRPTTVHSCTDRGESIEVRVTFES